MTPVSAVSSHFQDESINTEDGIKVTFSDSWVHIRPSNTEPIVRIFAEATSEQIANDLVSLVKGL